MDRLGELTCLGQIRDLRLHPQDVGERRDGERLLDGVGDSTLHLVVALGGLGDVRVEVHVEAEFGDLRLGGVPRRGARVLEPFLGRDARIVALFDGELDLVGDGVRVGAKPCGVLPSLDELVADGVECGLRRDGA